MKKIFRLAAAHECILVEGRTTICDDRPNIVIDQVKTRIIRFGKTGRARVVIMGLKNNSLKKGAKMLELEDHKKTITWIKKIFIIRDDCYSKCYWDEKRGRYSYKKNMKPIDDKLLSKHLTDDENPNIGIITSSIDNLTKLAVADFDFRKSGEIRAEDWEKIISGLCTLEKLGFALYQEKSKSGMGIHLWLFFKKPIPIKDAWEIMNTLLERAGLKNIEGFDRIYPHKTKSGRYGDIIHLVYDAHFVKKGGTVFYSNDDKKYIPDVNEFLKEIKRYDKKDFETITINPPYAAPADSDTVYEKRIIFSSVELLKEPFFRWCWDKPEEVNYWDWLALLSNLQCLENGSKWFHRFSERDPKRYTYSNTEDQIRKYKVYKPHTYGWIMAKGSAFPEKLVPSYKCPINYFYKNRQSFGVRAFVYLRKLLFSKKKIAFLMQCQLLIISLDQDIAAGNSEFSGKINESERKIARILNIPRSTLQSRLKMLNRLGGLDYKSDKRNITEINLHFPEPWKLPGKW